MRFTLIDRIIELEPGARITAVKNLSLAEEYLADHFPNFPVMPGVLMLEAMVQTSAWLIRATEDFAHSMVLLKQARNVKYGSFVEPGDTLTVQVEILKVGEAETTVKAVGKVNGQMTVNGRLVMSRYNLADRQAGREELDNAVRKELRGLFSILYQPQTETATK